VHCAIVRSHSKLGEQRFGKTRDLSGKKRRGLRPARRKAISGWGGGKDGSKIAREKLASGLGLQEAPTKKQRRSGISVGRKH